MRKVVLDTNIWVAAGFNSRSHSAAIITQVRQNELRLIWNDTTHRETRAVITKIPPLNWEDFSPLFTEAARFTEPTQPGQFSAISDPADRKFAALAAAAGAYLVTNDDHLLSVQGTYDLWIGTPAAFLDAR